MYEGEYFPGLVTEIVASDVKVKTMAPCLGSTFLAMRLPLKRMTRNDTATNKEINTFKKEAQCFILGILDEVFERSPIKDEFLRSCSVFDPAHLLSNTKEGLLNRFKCLLQGFPISMRYSCPGI